MFQHSYATHLGEENQLMLGLGKFSKGIRYLYALHNYFWKSDVTLVSIANIGLILHQKKDM